jgi:hypothetical protein
MNQSLYDQENNMNNNICELYSEDDIPKDILYQLHCKINQSIFLAEEYLVKNRPDGLLNNIMKINGQNIDMYDYLIIKDNLKNGEFAIVALSGENDLWVARKTHNNLIQYYNFTSEDKFATNDLFGLFTRNYKQYVHL